MKQQRFPRVPVLAVLAAALFLSLPAAAQQQEFELRKLSPEDRERILQEQGAPRSVPAPADVGAIPDEAQVDSSGIAYKILDDGNGDPPPGMDDFVTLHYTGWLQTGEMFGSTRGQREPQRVQVRQAAEGLPGILTQMQPGEMRRIWIPESIADDYRNEELEGHVVFDVELLSVTKAPAPPASVAAPPEGVTVTDSGISYLVLEEGRGGPSPQMPDLVLAHVSAWESNGTLTLSTEMEGQGPQSFVLDDMVRGFREMFTDMQVGERRRAWLPRNLASLPEMPLELQKPQTVELELVSFLPAPANLSAEEVTPPADATRTESGLTYMVLRDGIGETRPVADGTVVVHYAVWTADGSLLDSSFEAGKPYAMQLNDSLAPGYVEALQMMVEGEKMRIWVPEELGFVNARNLPEGPLVFDVDLIQVP